VKFIVFNYDRCIEHFLYHALQAYYGLNEGNATSVLERLTFYHPYGSVGPLPWMHQPRAVAYGEEVNADQFLESASQIETFTEGTDPESSAVADIQRCAGGASRVVFLGFAFHRQNLKLSVKPSALEPMPTAPGQPGAPCVQWVIVPKIELQVPFTEKKRLASGNRW
jgi:hypothetical protein